MTRFLKRSKSLLMTADKTMQRRTQRMRERVTRFFLVRDSYFAGVDDLGRTKVIEYLQGDDFREQADKVAVLTDLWGSICQVTLHAVDTTNTLCIFIKWTSIARVPTLRYYLSVQRRKNEDMFECRFTRKIGLLYCPNNP